MIVVERRASTDHSGSPVMIIDDNFTDQECPADSQIDRLNESTNAGSVERRSRETQHLEILGKVLQRVFKYFNDYHLVLLFLQYQLCSPLSAYLHLCLLPCILEFLFCFSSKCIGTWCIYGHSWIKSVHQLIIAMLKWMHISACSYWSMLICVVAFLFVI